jgi:phosphate starvation-inducible protein PhoH
MLRNIKTYSVRKVGNRAAPVLMKGKNKHRSYERNSWFDESDDDLFGRSPSSYVEDSFPGVHAIQMREQLKPRNKSQEEYLRLMESTSHPIVISTGPAGCGKSLWACATGVKMLQKGRVQKLILTRPAVSVDEEHGFLPGTLEEKMDPWIRPLYDVLYKYYTPKQITQLIEKQIIEICPLAYMRGRTFENAWIILDEAQNTLKSQMLMTLTRIGKQSKLIVTGVVRSPL